MKVYRKYKDYHKEIDGTLYKRCIDCNEWIIADLEHFGRDNGTKSKFNDRCKICQKTWSDAYYAKTRVHQIEKSKLNQKLNREKYLKYWSNRYYSTREEFIAQVIENAKKNPELHKTNQRNWRQRNPEKCRYYSSLHRSHDITRIEEEAMLNVFNYSCAYCGMTLEEHKKKYNQKLHNDHVDEDGSNDLRNDVPACQHCNTSKHESELEDWYFKQDYFDEDKYNIIIWWITEGYKEFIEDKPPYKIKKKQNDDKKSFCWQLWTVDEMRNVIEVITTGNKKKDILKYINDNSL